MLPDKLFWSKVLLRLISIFNYYVTENRGSDISDKVSLLHENFGGFWFALVAVLVVLLLVLLLNFEYFHIGSGADQRFQVFSFLNLVKNQLKFVGFDEVLRQHQLLCESH